MNHPYKDLPGNRFWKSAVVQSSPFLHEDIFLPKWKIDRGIKIATAGSCFAQQISVRLNRCGFNVVDYEPAPAHLPESLQKKHGYSLYSCRYGNIYTSRQLLQLARESFGLIDYTDQHQTIAWQSEGRYFDALRPTVEPQGYGDPEAVLRARCNHLHCVRRMFEEVDLLIFTLGLTETWMDEISGTVYPTAPGVVCSPCNRAVSFKNLCFRDVYEDLYGLLQLINSKRYKNIRILLTVSPVPLAATGSDQHILVANTYSKSILRSVAGDLSRSVDEFDYFPSFEIITNPARRGVYYENNLRSVRDDGVESVMRHFFNAYGVSAGGDNAPFDDDGQCEEALLGAFSPTAENDAQKAECIQVYGDSHLAAFLGAYERFRERQGVVSLASACFTPLNWAENSWWNVDEHKSFSAVRVRPEYVSRIKRFVNPLFNNVGKVLCLVGLDLLGNGIVNLHGPMKAGWVNADGSYPPGSDISPRVQRVASISEAEAVIGRALEKNLLEKKRFIETVVATGGWGKVFWICSPIMTQRTALYRLGEEYVFSGSQVYYNEVAQACFKKTFRGCPENIIVVSHSCNTEFGFAEDRFVPNDLPFDTHVSPEYFSEMVGVLFCPGG